MILRETNLDADGSRLKRDADGSSGRPTTSHARKCAPAPRPDSLVCVVPDPWLFMSVRDSSFATDDLRFVETRLHTNPALRRLEHASGVRAATARLSLSGLRRSHRSLRVLDLASADGYFVALARRHGHHAVGMEAPACTGPERLRQNVSRSAAAAPMPANRIG